MSLTQNDVAALVAFLQSLTEDYDDMQQPRVLLRLVCISFFFLQIRLDAAESR